MFVEDIRYDIPYLLEDEAGIDKILLDRAVEDSRKQAEVIASHMLCSDFKKQGYDSRQVIEFY